MAVAAADKKEEVVSVDEQFLKDYLARGGKAQVIGSEQEIDKENVDEFLRQQVASDQKTTKLDDEKQNRAIAKSEQKKDALDARLKRLQERAEARNAANEERLQREQQQQEQTRAAQLEKQREKEEKERLTESQKMRKALGNAASQFGGSVQPALDKISSLHTVGGIGLLVVILMILVFTVVQVNSQGDTRLKLLWAMLNGNAHLVGRVQVGGQASGNFGNTPGQGHLGNPGSGQIGNTSTATNSPIVPLAAPATNGFRQTTDVGF